MRQFLAQSSVHHERFHQIQTTANALDVRERPEQPAAQQARAHRRVGRVEHAQERRFPPSRHRFHELEVALSDAIDGQ